MMPPFEITGAMLTLVGEIERLIGRAEGEGAVAPQPKLRKQNRVRTVQGSVAIEGNTLTVDQVSAVLDGKRVLGERREIIEITNANAAYERASTFRAWRERDLLAAHRVLMTGLIETPGRYRATNVGVVQGTRVTHVAPPAPRVPALVAELLSWVRAAKVPTLVTSCVVHYELLFIHPFVDGNGRMARLWQLVTLLQDSDVFALVPVESVIRERQGLYYDVLGRCDRAGMSTDFIVFALEALRDALAETVGVIRRARATPQSRLEAAKEALGRSWFRRADYLAVHRSIATATASRDLALGVAKRVLEARGAHRMKTYRFRS